MAIRQIESAVRSDAALRTERGASEKRPTAREGEEVKEEGRVEISVQGERLRAQRDILTATFGGVEEASDADARALFEEAGRGEYLKSIEKPSDLSPEATAKRILDGITGYIYGAFRLGHPEASAEDFDRFAADALRGFEKGFGEARNVIEGLSALTPGLSKGIDRTESLVREGLDAFFIDERRRIEDAQVADQ